MTFRLSYKGDEIQAGNNTMAWCGKHIPQELNTIE
jgi:hypothetical protein